MARVPHLFGLLYVLWVLLGAPSSPAVSAPGQGFDYRQGRVVCSRRAFVVDHAARVTTVKTLNGLWLMTLRDAGVAYSLARCHLTLLRPLKNPTGETRGTTGPIRLRCDLPRPLAITFIIEAAGVQASMGYGRHVVLIDQRGGLKGGPFTMYVLPTCRESTRQLDPPRGARVWNR